jgi:diacylglycerol kinase family enzyme
MRRAIATRHLDDLPAAVRQLLVHERVNVLAANGGDGTVHALVNAVWELADDMEALAGRPLPLPRFLLLEGGTMNLLSRALGTRGRALSTVEWFVDRYGGSALSEVPCRELSVLAVEHAGRVRAGFVFGSELVRNALWVYGELGEGYRGLARLLFHATTGLALKTAIWRKYGHLLDPPRTEVWVDGVALRPYSVAVATTVDLELLGGAVRAARVDQAGGGFYVKIITETDKARLLALLPALLRNWEHPRVTERDGVESLAVRGPFTLDGELYGEGGGEVRVSLSPRRLAAVTPGAR